MDVGGVVRVRENNLRHQIMLNVNMLWPAGMCVPVRRLEEKVLLATRVVSNLVRSLGRHTVPSTLTGSLGPHRDRALHTDGRHKPTGIVVDYQD